MCPVLLDPGFEDVQVGAGRYQYRSTGSAWTFALNAGVTGNGSGFTVSNPPAPQGHQVAFLQTTGVIRQVVKGWSAGSYTLVFRAAQRGNSPTGSSKQDFAIALDGKVVATIKPSDTTYRTYYLFFASVAAGDHEIKFTGLNTAGGDNTAFIDDVSIVPSMATPGVIQSDVGGSGMVFAVPLAPPQEPRMLQFRCTDTRPISIGIQGPDGQWWDFTKAPGVWGPWVGPANNCLVTKPDPTFDNILSVDVPPGLVAIPGISLVVFQIYGTTVKALDVIPQSNSSWPTNGCLVWRP